MKRGALTLLSVTGSLIFTIGASAITAENPYQPIVDRNVFGLKPPPPRPDPNAEVKQPPPNIFLTGITTIFGNKRALLRSAPSAVKPGEKPVEQTYMLTEGQRDGDVEVLQIDEVKGIVKIRLAGKEIPLDFENNGVKIAAAPPPVPGMLPGMPPQPGLVRPAVPTPTGAPGFMPTALGQTSPTMPSRTVRLPGTTPAGATPASYGGVGVNLGGYNVTPGATPQPQIPNYSPEEQAILIEVERERNRARINAGVMAPPPITPITPREEYASPTPQPQVNQGNNMSPMPLPGRPIPIPQ